MITDTQGVEKLQRAINESNYIVFFGGAGVSTESGIPDFRSQDGLYNQKYKYPPEEIVSHTFLVRRTEEFYEFYKDKMLAPDSKPNAAHYKLAELEKSGKLKAVIVTGCLGERYSEDIHKEIPQVDAILGISGWDKIAECLDTVLKDNKKPVDAVGDKSGRIHIVYPRYHLDHRGLDILHHKSAKEAAEHRNAH